MASEQEIWQRGGAEAKAEYEAELEKRIANFQAKLPSPSRLALDFKKQHKLLMETLSSDGISVLEFIKLCKENREDTELMLAFHGIGRTPQKHEHTGAGGGPIEYDLRGVWSTITNGDDTKA